MGLPKIKIISLAEADDMGWVYQMSEVPSEKSVGFLLELGHYPQTRLCYYENKQLWMIAEYKIVNLVGRKTDIILIKDDHKEYIDKYCEEFVAKIL